MEKQHLGIGAASKILGVHPNTIRDWLKKGKIKAYFTPGGRWRISREDLKRITG